MLPAKFYEHTRRQVQINLEAQPCISEALREIDADTAARGFTLPGNGFGKKHELLKQAARTSAEIVWHSIREVHVAFGQPAEDGLRGELVAEFDKQFAGVELRLIDTLNHVALELPRPLPRILEELAMRLRAPSTDSTSRSIFTLRAS